MTIPTAGSQPPAGLSAARGMAARKALLFVFLLLIINIIFF
jgi:hypothetical protein